MINFALWVLVFKQRLIRVGLTFIKTQPVNIGQEISVQLETNEDSKKIDPYCCAIKTMVSGKLVTVGHIPSEVSRHTYFYIKEEGGRIDGSVSRHVIVPYSSLAVDLKYR